jgi:hypothetical protein
MRDADNEARDAAKKAKYASQKAQDTANAGEDDAYDVVNAGTLSTRMRLLRHTLTPYLCWIFVVGLILLQNMRLKQYAAVFMDFIHTR